MKWQWQTSPTQLEMQGYNWSALDPKLHNYLHLYLFFLIKHFRILLQLLVLFKQVIVDLTIEIKTHKSDQYCFLFWTKMYDFTALYNNMHRSLLSQSFDVGKCFAKINENHYSRSAILQEMFKSIDFLYFQSIKYSVLT